MRFRLLSLAGFCGALIFVGEGCNGCNESGLPAFDDQPDLMSAVQPGGPNDPVDLAVPGDAIGGSSDLSNPALTPDASLADLSVVDPSDLADIPDLASPLDLATPPDLWSPPDLLLEPFCRSGGVPAKAPWPMAGACPDRRSRSSVARAIALPVIKAQTAIDITAAPAIGEDGTLYVPGAGGVQAVEPVTLKILWTFKAGAVARTPTLGANGMVYFSSADMGIYGVDARSGAKRWVYLTKAANVGAPVLGADGTVYVGGGDGALYALDPATGKERWREKTLATLPASAAVGLDGTIYFSSADGVFRALDPKGNLLWSIGTNGPATGPSVDGSGAVYLQAAGGTLAKLNGATGVLSFTWEFDGSAGNESPAIGPNGWIYVAVNGPRRIGIYAFDTIGKTLKWLFEDKAASFVGVTVDDSGTVYAASSSDGHLYAFDGQNGKILWDLKQKFTTAASIGADGTLYIADAQNLYALAP